MHDWVVRDMHDWVCASYARLCAAMHDFVHLHGCVQSMYDFVHLHGCVQSMYDFVHLHGCVQSMYDFVTFMSLDNTK